MEDKRTFIGIGGQACIEGIAMKGENITCLAVRKKDGSIYKENFNNKNKPFAKVPILRGAAALVMSLISGYKYIDISANVSGFYDEDDSVTDNKSSDKSGSSMDFLTVIASVIGLVLAVLLFTVLPTWTTGLITRVFGLSHGYAVIEAVIKVLIFVAYLFFATRMKEVHRVFEYHGAEHKTINCVELGHELNVENVKKMSRFHPRCGTSFMFLIVFISILVYSFIPWTGVVSRSLMKIITIPVITGLSYEVLQFVGKHDNYLTHILAAPGMAIQRLTTFEPEDDMIEIAIAAFNEVYEK